MPPCYCSDNTHRIDERLFLYNGTDGVSELIGNWSLFYTSRIKQFDCECVSTSFLGKQIQHEGSLRSQLDFTAAPLGIGVDQFQGKTRHIISIWRRNTAAHNRICLVSNWLVFQINSVLTRDSDLAVLHGNLLSPGKDGRTLRYYCQRINTGIRLDL